MKIVGLKPEKRVLNQVTNQFLKVLFLKFIRILSRMLKVLRANSEQIEFNASFVERSQILFI